jgi:outer membrane protein OmpA-like peptidoglycan-associated protein
MTRLAVPILILLLMLFAGAVWLLAAYVDIPQLAGRPPAEAPAVSDQSTPADATRSSASTAEAPSADGQPDASFDVARIDPQGTSVFAGRAEPGSTVTIVGDGKPVGTAQADENGEWTFATEHPFASAEPKLALSVKSAAETKADKEKADQTKVAGSLETREPPKDGPEHKSAGTVASNLLKDFEGMVAAARTEAEKEKQEAAESQAKAESETKSEEKAESKAADPSQPAQAAQTEVVPKEQKEARVVVPEPPLQPSPPPATPAGPQTSQSPPQQDAPPPSTSPPARLAATGPEKPAASNKPIPVPITFVFNEATFTPEGRKAVSLLLEYLQLKHFGRVSMTGHADERGSDELNMDLSKERLDAVAGYLKSGGYDGKLQLIPKGKTEPYAGVDRSKYSKEDLYQLDRRVELNTTP